MARGEYLVAPATVFAVLAQAFRAAASASAAATAAASGAAGQGHEPRLDLGEVEAVVLGLAPPSGLSR